MNPCVFDQPEGKSLNIMQLIFEIRPFKTLHKSGLRKVKWKLVTYESLQSDTKLLYMKTCPVKFLPLPSPPVNFPSSSLAATPATFVLKKSLLPRFCNLPIHRTRYWLTIMSAC